MPVLPRTFVITLPEATARQAALTKRLEELGLPFEWFPGVDGRGFDVPTHPDYDGARRRRWYGKDLSGGELGCALSHKRLYEKIVSENIDSALVLEDDVVLDDQFATAVSFLHQSGYPYDFIRFLGSAKNKRKIESGKGKPLLGLPTGDALYKMQITPGGAHAYLIRKSGAEKLLKHMDKIWLPADMLMGRSWMTGCANLGVPALAWHDEEEHSFTGHQRFEKPEAAPPLYALTRPAFKAHEAIMKRVRYHF